MVYTPKKVNSSSVNNKRATYLFPAIGIAILVGILTLLPALNVNKVVQIEQSDKIAHFMAYFIIGLTTVWGIYKMQGLISRKNWIVLIVAISGYGILLEIAQKLFTSHRQLDPLDMVANIAGVVVAWALSKIVLEFF